MATNQITDFIVLRALTAYINKEADGFYVEKIYSANKNELIFLLRYKDSQFCFEVYMDNFTSFIFFPDFANAGRNAKLIFPELDNKRLIQINPIENDRSLRMDFEGGFSLFFKMYGRNANIILFSKKNVLSILRPQFINDLESKLPLNIVESKVDTSKSSFYIGNLNSALYFTLTPENDGLLLKTDNISEAVNFFASEYFYGKSFLDKKAKLLQDKIKQKEHFEKSLQSAKNGLELLEKDKSYKIQADIIMANLHNIPDKVELVQLYDYYHDKQITIRLKKDVSPQKFAETLYRKAKRQEVEKEMLMDKIISMEAKLEAVEKDMNRLEKAGSPKELRPFVKEETANDIREQFPFKRALINGYEVYIGKNAKNNDELLRYAHKEDIWLHAKGVSGSHVIIRRKGKNPVPKEIIERAASLAAWNSKGKSAGLSPVIYTIRKYVRKPKGAAPGAVICEKEEVVIVEPLKNV
jgi:predicted ribosome quality control (RQC) complex YloA/Tae2 family protein